MINLKKKKTYVESPDQPLFAHLISFMIHTWVYFFLVFSSGAHFLAFLAQFWHIFRETGGCSWKTTTKKCFPWSIFFFPQAGLVSRGWSGLLHIFFFHGLSIVEFKSYSMSMQIPTQIYHVDFLAWYSTVGNR